LNSLAILRHDAGLGSGIKSNTALPKKSPLDEFEHS